MSGKYPYRSEALPQASPPEAYEQNHGELLELAGRLTARLNANYRNDKPRTWEHVGRQEELIAMMRDVLEFMERE